MSKQKLFTLLAVLASLGLSAANSLSTTAFFQATNTTNEKEEQSELTSDSEVFTQASSTAELTKEQKKFQKKRERRNKRYERKRRKSEESYYEGFYNTAYGKYNFFIRSEEKFDSTGNVFISTLLLRSKYADARGALLEAEKLLLRGERMFYTYSNIDEPYFIETLNDLVEAANAYQRPIIAYKAVQYGNKLLFGEDSISVVTYGEEERKEWLDTAKENSGSVLKSDLNSASLSGFVPDSVKELQIAAFESKAIMAHHFNELLIETQAERGFYADAIERCETAIEKAEQLAVKKRWIRNKNGSGYKKKKLDRRTRFAYFDDLAHLKVLYADLHRLSGDYIKAEALYKRNEKQLKKLVKKKGFVYLRNAYGIAMLKKDMGQSKEARKELAWLYKQMKRSNKISPNHMYFYQVIQDVGNAYNDEGKNRKYKKTTKRFRDEVRLKYGKKSPYYSDARLLLNEKIVDRNQKRANRRLKRYKDNSLDFIPPSHAANRQFNNQFYDIYLQRNQYANARQVLIDNAILDSVNMGTSAPLYHASLLRRAAFETDYTNEFGMADSLYNLSFEKYVRRQLHPFHKDYLVYIDRLAALQFETDRFDEALSLLEEAQLITRQKFGANSAEYGEVLQKIAKVYIKKSEFVLAQRLLEKAEAIIRDDAGRKNLPYARLLRTLGELYSLNGNFEEAEKAIQKSQRILQRLGSEAGPAVSSTDELIQLYINQGNYGEAEDLVETTLELRKAKYGEVHYQLILPFNYKGQLHLIDGDFVNAEKAVQEALSITENTVTDTSSKYNENLALLSDIYREMGDYESAEGIYGAIIANNKKIFGEASVKVSESYLGMAKVLDVAGAENQKTLAYIDSAEVIIAAKLGKEHPRYAEALLAEAKVLIELSEYDKAEGKLNTAKAIFLDKFGSKSATTASVFALLGDLYYAKGDFSKAISQYEEAMDTYKKVFSSSHPEFVKNQSKLAYSYYAKGDYSQSDDIMRESLEEYLTYIRNYFPALSDKEKNNYWSTIKPDFDFYNSLAINHYKSNSEVLGQMYNNKIATKAILLSSSIKVRQRILSSQNEELINKYLSWQSKKETLTKAISMSAEEQEKNNISIPDLEKEINEIEKYLSEESEAFAENYESKTVEWKDVQKELKDGEVAVELIRFQYFDTQFTDSVIYAALVLSKNSKNGPTLVLLPNGVELEGKYYNYYRNVIKYKAKDKNSYEQYWAAVESKLPGTTKAIYLSPDGIYNQLNIETLQRESGKYLIDDYTVYTISNTKEIVLQQYKEDEEYATSLALMFGNPSFSGGGDGDMRNANAVSSVEPLPGAEEEVKMVSNLLKQKNWNAETYIENSASEQAVKKASNPRLIHIATHGFFMDTESPTNANAEIAENPLMKSGLLFADAADLIAENNVYNFNKREGVLTAFEAMNLNLDHTELVVLSACETGLGEIKSGEGVFGLQRSFLVAGAKNVIMTLFKVNDEVTQELMQNFYSEWLETGDKRQAFINAKKKIKEKYESPIYWGSFVMIGLD